MLEDAGFTVLEYERDDTQAVRDLGRALGWDQATPPIDVDNDLFASYTLLKKPG